MIKMGQGVDCEYSDDKGHVYHWDGKGGKTDLIKYKYCSRTNPLEPN